MRLRLLLASLLSLGLLLALPLAAQPSAPASPKLQAVPSPDLSRLTPERARELREQRASFDKSKDVLIGDPLAETYALLGAAYARNGLFDAADVALADATVLAPRNGGWVYLRGLLAAMRDQHAQALKLFEGAHTLSPDYLPIAVTLATALMDARDLEGAKRVLEPWAQRKQAVPLTLLGDIAMQQKRPADAVASYRRALEFQPEANRLNGLLADALAANGDAKGAAAERAKAGDRMPGLNDPIGRHMFGDRGAAGDAGKPAASPRDQAIDNALAQMEVGKYTEARRTLDAALQASRNDSMLLALYGRVETAAGNLDAAASRLRSALAADPKNSMALTSEALIAQIRNDDAGAERLYRQAIEIEPRLVSARLGLGTLQQRNKRYDDARVQYKAVLGVDALNAEAWARLVAVDAISGRCAETLKTLNDALRGSPDSPFLLQLFVRNVSTCAAASADEKRMALDYAKKIYQANSAPVLAEAYALALAANGKWDEAVATEQGAMFIVLRDGGEKALVPYREILDQLRAHKLPTLPWSASSPLFNPQRPQVAPPAK